MRDFLYSEISQIESVSNIPDNPDLAIEVGKMLCSEVLEPIQEKLGRIEVPENAQLDNVGFLLHIFGGAGLALINEMERNQRPEGDHHHKEGYTRTGEYEM